MKFTIRQKISFSIIAVVLVVLLLFSLISQWSIRGEFRSYIESQQRKQTETIVNSLDATFTPINNEWNESEIHAIGMSALYEGFIIKVSDISGNTVWDAETHDMGLCNQVRSEIIERMEKEGNVAGGEFSTNEYELKQQNVVIGTVTISFYGPYFYSQDDFVFLQTLNQITYVIGGISLVLAIVIGYFLAKNISKPISNAVHATNEIANGNYSVRNLPDTNVIELNELSASIHKLADSITAQESLRKQLTADVAHELRTPLTAVSTHLEAMIEGIWEPTNERLTSCHEEVNRIIAIVKDLEQLELIENKRYQLHYTTFSLDDLVTKVCNNFAMQMNEKSLLLSIEGKGLSLHADYERVTQIVVNLLSNAIKYTNEGDQIHIKIYKENSMVVLSIEDTGIGMSKEQLPYIFERFYRVDKSRNRKTGGAGIGLTIVNSLVEAQGGNITIDSELGVGTRVKVEFPSLESSE